MQWGITRLIPSARHTTRPSCRVFTPPASRASPHYDQSRGQGYFQWRYAGHPKRQRRKLSVEWNATQSDYPRNQRVPEPFEAQVERTPYVLALVYDKEEVSYRE